ncbi:MAG: tRNA (guanosine(46)-N7)-methyltransferase TrmB [Eubacterium sp.]|nr:tRNA (guanosine(46)-N7)-methyltransferase TrmB [Eubacterium sp.]
MRLRNIPGSREVIAESEFVIHNEEEKKGHWKEIFGNNNPIHIEIGMGKGTFIMESAKRNPDINYIGIEKYSSVLLRAIEKREQEPELPNLYFIRMDAEYIENVFDKDEVSNIYLNFSDPWPKDRNAKRRLTSDRFLKRYTNIMKKDGRVRFKTDNINLFEYSLETAKECGWEILYETRDLHKSEYNEGNIMTEYEKKFSQLGNKINMMIITQP